MRMFKKLTISNTILILLISILAISVSGHLIDFFIATQEGDITIDGNSCLLLFDGHPLNDYSIPLTNTSISIGELCYEGHTIYNNDPTNSYNITFNIEDSWFDNTSHPWYGFTYGVNNITFYNLVGTTTTVDYKKSFYFHFWYQVDGMMITPTEDAVHVKIDVTAVKGI